MREKNIFEDGIKTGNIPIGCHEISARQILRKKTTKGFVLGVRNVKHIILKELL